MINDKIIYSRTPQQSSNGLCPVACYTETLSDQTTVELWLAPLVTNAEDAGSNPGTHSFGFFLSNFQKMRRKQQYSITTTYRPEI